MGKDPEGQPALRAELSRQLNSLVEASPGTYRHLYVLDRASGQLLASAESGPDVAQVVPDALLAQAYAPGMREFISVQRNSAAEVVITQQISSIDGQGNPDGPALGLLVAVVVLEAPLHSNEDSMRQILGLSGQIMLVDRDANILFRAVTSVEAGDPQAVARQTVSGTEGARLMTTDAGDEIITVFRYIHLGAADDLSLVVTRRTDDALAVIRGSFWRMLGLVSVFLLAALGLVVFAADRVARAEAQVLALNANLEVRIAERTKELGRANSDLRDSFQRLEQTRDELVRSEKIGSVGGDGRGDCTRTQHTHRK
ncbi:MAG: hypothetical protein U5M53_03335 [Rhodoferax sp.]|nr:hypothetical protein [Rhodoferax sp.]